MNRFKAPEWKSRAVHHKYLVMKRILETRIKKERPGYFLNSEDSASNGLINNKPRRKGRRINLDLIGENGKLLDDTPTLTKRIKR